MATDATVRVSRELRDRINTNARRAGQTTVDKYLRDVLDRDDWRHRLEVAADDMRSAASDTEYQEDIAAWDNVSTPR